MVSVRAAKYPKLVETEGFATASKTEAVKTAISEGLESIDDIRDFVRAKFGHDMPKSLVSSYKSRLSFRDATEEARAAKPSPEPEPTGKTMNKSEATRAAIDAGYDKPATAVDYIKNTFGVEIGGQHFSAIKSQYLKAQAAAKPKGKPGRKPREAAPLVEGYVAPPTPAKKAVQGDGDLMLALEGVKDLVGQFGAERVKKMVDLLS